VAAMASGASIGVHDEDLHRVLPVRAVIDALQPPVEPAQLQHNRVDRLGARVRAEIAPREAAEPNGCGTMGRGPDAGSGAPGRYHRAAACRGNSGSYPIGRWRTSQRYAASGR